MTYSIQVAPWPDDDPSEGGHERIFCPTCDSEWVSAGTPEIETSEDEDVVTVPFGCAHCCHQWELVVHSRKGQASVSYGPRPAKEASA
jgi:hypothetical protein